MNAKTWRRIAIAALVSLSCYGLVTYWYKSTQNNFANNSNAKPVAYVDYAVDEVSRRPVSRLIWQIVNTGEPLFPGEAIKTSSTAEVRIQFAEGKRFIDLEPDSLIVISKSEKGIDLDLMDGSFFVGQGEKSADDKASDDMQLTLNSKQGKVDLSKATATLSKSNGDKIDVQVLKGKATVEGADGNAKELDANSQTVTIISPELDKPTYVNIEDIQPIEFKWKGLPTTAKVQLWIGKNKKDFKFLSESAVGQSNLTAKVLVGKYNFKLIAIDPITQKNVGESLINRLEVVGRYAPVAIFPEPNATVVRDTNPFKMRLRWSKPQQAKNVYLELSKDPTFKQKLYTKNFLTEESMEFTFPEGDYYWRLSSQYEGLEKAISTKIQKFSVSGKPKAQRPPVVIGWVNPEEKNPQYYLDKPMAQLAWLTEQKDQVKFWRLYLAENETLLADPSKTKPLTTKEFSAKTAVAKPGRYIAMVEAVDETNQVLAKSTYKTIEISPLPLLPAPKFIPETGDLKADNKGRLILNWTELAGAKEYELTLLDKDGKELKTGKFNKNSTSMVNLLPGKYRVSVFAIDQHGRPSPKEEARTVIVPDGSGLGAPKLKKIQVK